ncbi:MAG TPA: hypothetical protein VHC86_12515 [Opitutaceae bacterium]|nr:hypothetical protein [Opitutaceae bacterium]
MSRRLRILCGLGALAGAGLLLSGCVGEGYAGADVDYYGPAYGGPVYYGHPWYHNDVIITHAPDRHFAPRPSVHHEEPHAEHHEAPRGGGHPHGDGHDGHDGRH